MSIPQPAPSPAVQALEPRHRKKVILRTVGVAAGVFVVAWVIGGRFGHLILGWLLFLCDVIPRMTVDWPTAIVGGVCVVLFVLVLHATLRWLFMQKDDSSLRRWSWRSTLAIAAFVLVLFAAGTAMVGATHQAIWLMTGRRVDRGPDLPMPQYYERLGFFSFLNNVAEHQAIRQDLRSTGLALQNYADTYKDHLPPGGTMRMDGTLLHGWAIFLGNYTTYSSQGIDFSVPWNKPPNRPLYQCVLQDYINPSQPGPRFDHDGFGLSHVAANQWVFPITTLDNKQVSRSSNFRDQGTRLQDMTGGTANTILLGTAAGDFLPWGHPANVRDPGMGINTTPKGFGGPPNWNGGLMVMADGHVQFFSNKTDPDLLKKLATPSGGEPLDEDGRRLPSR